MEKVKETEKEPVKIPPTEVNEEILTRDRKRNKRTLIKIVALNVTNLLLIFAIFYILGKLPDIASEIKQLRSAQYAAQGVNDAEVLRADINKNSGMVDSLEKLFIDKTSVVDLSKTLSSIRDEGSINEFDFPGSRVITDKSGQTVLPILIIFHGSRDQVNDAMNRVFSLPFMFKTQSVEVDGTPEELTLTYNGFILANENFEQN